MFESSCLLWAAPFDQAYKRHYSHMTQKHISAVLAIYFPTLKRKVFNNFIALKILIFKSYLQILDTLEGI
jgi:hypothetical protein